MNYLSVFQSKFSMIFLFAINITSHVLFAENERDDRSKSGCFDGRIPEHFGIIKQFSTWWQQRKEKNAEKPATLCVGEKPKTIETGYYDNGRYVQFAFDAQGFMGGLAAGCLFRLLYSVATCGAEYKKFRSAAVAPGVAKSLMFWVPCLAAYHSIVNGKLASKMRERLSNEEFVRKVQDRLERNDTNNPFSGI